MSALQSLPLSDSNRREVKRFVKFAMVGTAGMLTHMTIFNILMLGLRLYPTTLANAIGFSDRRHPEFHPEPSLDLSGKP